LGAVAKVCVCAVFILLENHGEMCMGMFSKLLTRNTFAHGVHPETHKDITSHLPIKRLPFAPRLILPLAQHFGRASKAIVRVGQEVVRGEPIAEADGFLSVPLHAPASGKIESIGLMPSARGPKVESIVLKTYTGATQRILYGMERDIIPLEGRELIDAIQATGMVGLGGAGFPTHVKLSVPEEFKVDTLVVNGCECEPYLTTDHRLMLEYPRELLQGIHLVMRAVDAEQAIIGIEDNKADAAKALQKYLSPYDPVTVRIVQTKYPQGSEKLLIKVLLDREVPSGGFPYQVGAVVQNVATLAQLGMLLPKNQGLIERIITITGPGIKKPGNYIVPIGTPLRFLLEAVGFSGQANQLILGGPMMGGTVASLDVPVTKPVSGVLVLNHALAEQKQDKIYPCIKCGHCVEACPIHLNPSMLGQLAAKRQYETMRDHFHLNDCFECGCCSYVCPSNIPLVQYFRIAKSINRERTLAAKAY
jgi:Na+-translocating ferredoxin:NAD+ oxidoreductase subunit C